MNILDATQEISDYTYGVNSWKKIKQNNKPTINDTI